MHTKDNRSKPGLLDKNACMFPVSIQGEAKLNDNPGNSTRPNNGRMLGWSRRAQIETSRLNLFRYKMKRQDEAMMEQKDIKLTFDCSTFCTFNFVALSVLTATNVPSFNRHWRTSPKLPSATLRDGMLSKSISSVITGARRAWSSLAISSLTTSLNASSTSEALKRMHGISDQQASIMYHNFEDSLNFSASVTGFVGSSFLCRIAMSTWASFA